MGLHPSFPCLPFQSSIPLSYLPLKTMGCFSGRLMSAASDQKLFCKLCSPCCCSFDEFVEEKVISPSYSSAILTPPPSPCYSLELFSFAFHFSSFQSDLQGLLKQPFCFLTFLFLGDVLDPCLLYSITNLHPQFIRHFVYQI